MVDPDPGSVPSDRAVTEPDQRDVVPFREAVRAWFLISLQTFGGPAGQIAVMERTLVEERRWIGHRRFLHALSYCTLLPGPEAQQLAIYVGWLLNGVRGGLVAGTLFVLPGVIALLGLSAIYVAFGENTVVAALFAGLAPAVVAVVAQAVVRLGKRALGHPALVALAVVSFLALTAFQVPFPAVIAVAALVGWMLGRWAPRTMRRPREPGRGRRCGRASHPRRRPAPRTAEPSPHRAGPRDRSGRLGRANRAGRRPDGYRQCLHTAGAVLLRRGAGHLRRCLRRARVRRTAGRRGIRMAHARRDGAGLALAESTRVP